MEEKKGSLLGSIIDMIKYTVIALLFWYIIAAGWNGWYIAYQKKVLNRVPDNEMGERFGNKVFLLWMIIFTIGSFYFDGSYAEEGTAYYNFIWANIVFFSVSILGFGYFFEDLP